MEDFIGKLVVAVLGIFLLFYMPVLAVAQKQDLAIQAYVDDKVEDFVYKSVEAGYVSTRNYLEMIDALDATGITYDIDMTYSKRRVFPVFDDAGNPTGEYEVHYTDYVKDEIEAVIFNGQKGAYVDNEMYYMEHGDHFQCVVHNESKTLGSKLLQLLTTRDTEKNIVSSCGGYVGNTAQ